MQLCQAVLPYPRLQRHQRCSSNSQQSDFSANCLRSTLVTSYPQPSRHRAWTIRTVAVDSWFALPLWKERYRKLCHDRFRCAFYMHVTTLDHPDNPKNSNDMELCHARYIGLTWPRMYRQIWPNYANARAANRQKRQHEPWHYPQPTVPWKSSSKKYWNTLTTGLQLQLFDQHSSI